MEHARPNTTSFFDITPRPARPGTIFVCQRLWFVFLFFSGFVCCFCGFRNIASWSWLSSSFAYNSGLWILLFVLVGFRFPSFPNACLLIILLWRRPASPLPLVHRSCSFFSCISFGLCLRFSVMSLWSDLLLFFLCDLCRLSFLASSSVLLSLSLGLCVLPFVRSLSFMSFFLCVSFLGSVLFLCLFLSVFLFECFRQLSFSRSFSSGPFISLCAFFFPSVVVTFLLSVLSFFPSFLYVCLSLCLSLSPSSSAPCPSFLSFLLLFLCSVGWDIKKKLHMH